MQAYIISRADLGVKAIAVLVRYEFNEDTVSPCQSVFVFAAAVNAATGDYLLVRNEYLGVVSGIEADKNTSVLTIHALPVSSIFSRNILLGTGQDITENYIQSAINDNFVSSGDALLDDPNISVSVQTQTVLGITPHNDNGIYNLDTFLRYAAKRHNIYTDFELTSITLNVSLENRIPPTHIIDATVADVLSVDETMVSECVSKVTVKTSTDVVTCYLFDDGSYNTDPEAGTRVTGKAETVYTENTADAEKTAGDVFAKNMYSHLIEAEMLLSSKLYDVHSMKLYDRAKVKTKTGVYDTYISYIAKRSAEQTVLFKFGDAKLSLTDKLKGGA